jgi:hypothetical protein
LESANDDLKYIPMNEVLQSFCCLQCNAVPFIDALKKVRTMDPAYNETVLMWVSFDCCGNCDLNWRVNYRLSTRAGGNHADYAESPTLFMEMLRTKDLEMYEFNARREHLNSTIRHALRARDQGTGSQLRRVAVDAIDQSYVKVVTSRCEWWAMKDYLLKFTDPYTSPQMGHVIEENREGLLGVTIYERPKSVEKIEEVQIFGGQKTARLAVTLNGKQTYQNEVNDAYDIATQKRNAFAASRAANRAYRGMGAGKGVPKPNKKGTGKGEDAMPPPPPPKDIGGEKYISDMDALTTTTTLLLVAAAAAVPMPRGSQRTIRPGGCCLKV